ncbi:hypothetical protein C0585_05020 [Candidatus Woesearchaeota archaeon]|nr:MAG: hypothetical protein C0585_05020 [Candidatus Woesearchaeota archaeon]
METEKFERIDELLSQISEKTYLRAEDDLLKIGINPHIDIDSLEQKLEEEIVKTPRSEPEKVLKNYGLTHDYLSNCEKKNFLKETYLGLMNISTNHDLLSNLNPTEVIALGYAAYKLKKDSSFNEKIQNEARGENASKTIAKIIGTGYENGNILNFLKIDPKPHSTDSGSLVKRLHENVGCKTLKDLATSLFRPYREIHDNHEDSISPKWYRMGINKIASSAYNTRK